MNTGKVINTGNIFKDIPLLETERLILRKLSMRDVNDVFEYASVPEIAKHVMWQHHRSIADSMHFLRAVILQYQNGMPSPWGIVYKENNKVIGTGGFHVWNAEHRKAEIGYALSPVYWNKGIMTEALKIMIKFGFDSLNLNRIEALCFVQNTTSERVMQKCGMTFEGILRQYTYIKEGFQDLKLYSILKSEFN
jgi:ribosomal-protein-alanine N-acetyltransferase